MLRLLRRLEKEQKNQALTPDLYAHSNSHLFEQTSRKTATAFQYRAADVRLPQEGFPHKECENDLSRMSSSAAVELLEDWGLIQKR